MGGHGGLNILPQKKWNVYNYDNRDIVDKDKKIASEKQKRQREKEREDLIDRKMNVMKEEFQIQEPKQIKSNSLIVQELKALQEKKKHINLFQKEQQILQTRDLMEIKRLRQAEFLKDKNMDFSSRFLGTYGDEKALPWYNKGKYEKQKKDKRQKYQRYTNGIDLELRQFQDMKHERSRDKMMKKQISKEDSDSQEQKIKCNKIKNQYINEISMVKKEEKISRQTCFSVEELRLQRLKREEKERKRAQNLKKMKNGLLN